MKKKLRNVLALFMVTVLAITSNAINVSSKSGDDNVVNGVAATALDLDDSAAYDTETADDSSSTTPSLKYYSATLYDYDADTINAATDAQEETNATVYEGIYFNDGSPEYVTETVTDLTEFVEGQYYVQNIRASENGVGSWLVGSTSAITSTSEQDDATLWTLTIEDGSYYLTTTLNNTTTYYMKIGSGEYGDALTTTKTPITISSFSGNPGGVQISNNGYYLCWRGSTKVNVYGGYNANNAGGNGMRFYRVDGDTLTLTTVEEGATTVVSGYEAWNSWNKASGDNSNGQKTYTGLVESTLDANKNIVFTKPEGGIFNSDSTVKSIYTNVEVPFVYSNGYYTFDTSVNGVYFHEDETQGSSGTAAKNTRLYFDEGNTQHNNTDYGDGSTTVWMPFNDEISINGETNCNYHFGMQATIPFTMTANGRKVATNDSSEAIEFSFSGDDDVWIFIDGKLVVDLGGIHNRLDASINFAGNTVTYSESNASESATGSYNDKDFKLVQTLFGGLISQDRETFSASGSHELTIYYLERGMGSSNCQIKFNLPVNDTVTVTKDATQSWSENDQIVTPLTSVEQGIVNNIDFGFTLYRSTDDGTTYTPVANTNYNLLNANGQVLSTPSTDAYGHFTLKNGQSARFISTQMDDEAGVTYYVVEDDVNGFVEPDYNYSGEAQKGFKNVDTGVMYTSASDIPELELHGENMTSDKITVYGSSDKDDSLVFICSNFLDAQLPNPSARPVDDKIVIDYGLPVEIDVLTNDVYRGDKIELVSVTGDGVKINSETGMVTEEGQKPVYGTTEIKNGKLTYKLNKQLSGVEKLNYVVKVTGSETNEATGVTVKAYEYAVATVYIIPATSMYYEEDFEGLISFTKGEWSTVGTAETNNQEPGVVGTVGDSPYGSDVAYINDSGDSNGSSMYVSTTNGAAQFQYKFTGWGTSFFARTSNNSGYMKVVITDSEGATVYQLLRNTIYKELTDVTGPLYNVPVFTYNVEDYGTYTVTVTIAKSKVNGIDMFGSEFWLDGIKVVNPINLEDTTVGNDSEVAIATSAYAADAEANMSVKTLRYKLLTDVTGTDADGKLIWDGVDEQDGNFVLFTDNNGAMTSASDYQSYGPKEEVYLYNGQKVSFSLVDWDADTNKIYLGMKAPTGSAKVLINNNEVVLYNAADCYFDITNYAVITTADDGTKTATFEIQAAIGSLVSVTNIKVTGNAQFAIVNKNEDIEVEGDGE